jgi:hypothetical protein
LASVDFLVLFLWDFLWVELDVVVPEASVFLVVVEDSLVVSEDFGAAAAGLAVGAGAADCCAMAATGNARARTRPRTFFMDSLLYRDACLHRVFQEATYAGADEPNMNTSGM